MAVEAHRLLLAQQGQKQFTNAAAAGWPWTTGDEPRCAMTAMPSHHHQQAPFQFQQQASCVGVGLPAPPVSSAAPVAQYAAGGQMFVGDAAESGVTFGGGAGAAQQEMVAMAMAPRKRKRVVEQGQTPPVLEIGAADVAAHFHQQLVDVDRLVLQHTAKMWADLTEQRRRHARQVVATVEAAAGKRLRAKEEEIQRMGRLNWALEERVKSLYVEAQVWRDLAQSNEAASNALRGELQQALDAQQARLCGGAAGAGTGTGGADDAESCCCGENDVVAGAGAGGAGPEDEEEAGTSSPPGQRRTCAVCGEGAAEVLLLPCRHLCACAPCAGAARACPACGCAKNGSVCVNFS
ncbi:unnamed protein product [Miscanthus lutarioriparius]|uniref:RING-type domain-containing protein n=1 Tax=Miscanthus lutarioriparius TaxID=422564 RepID=A0A811MFQ9_9POAL|nr:unnamed protein product [Miscanthus lutarioriparius]